ncbi:hypothetical protein [Streptomyces rapamycinicus]|uniref:Uncharacterized protein n=1 Tax=Streptomyces rapamycinicus TaxID=1226757 RepID=A0ABR6LBA0_9ACTN|nr:hypothetical protein [Streptomyces rapamycinicus]AGP51980.1 hypothetical protein M271_01720 [Streptomyces rapamycinicus NRRL 5491]MBB4779401.1 hypothetical protein [Streptomyces rapamycinicus]
MPLILPWPVWASGTPAARMELQELARREAGRMGPTCTADAA